MLKISKLSVFVADTSIIKDISITVERGSLHLLMGPNGSGKSTFSYALAGHPRYTTRAKELVFLGEELQELSPDKRAQKGIFLAVQNPPEIPGVTVLQFLKEAHAACTGQAIGVEAFKQVLDPYLERLKFDASFLQRSLNENFSGGEKKRLELLQLMMLKPKLAILDEIDSGLDIDALALVSSMVEQFRKENPESSLLIITHNPRIAQFLNPDHVHILNKGSLALSGKSALIAELENKGYDGLLRS
jgi:Fe-S cluster assembly ATP-binding protein